MKYEDADIFAFIPNKMKQTSAPENATISEKDAGSGKTTASKESPDNETKGRKKDSFNETSDPDTQPVFEEFPAPSPETLIENDPQNFSDTGSKIFAKVFPVLLAFLELFLSRFLLFFP